jgi:pimeloyl-ACP methyl ester carboxylesterase
MEDAARRSVAVVPVATGITVSYSVAGPCDGPLVVLLHPWLESHDAFSLVVPHLPAMRVLAPDQRGRGDSDKPSGGYDLPSLARDVLGLLDALAIDSVVLVGASSGGYVAQQFAASYPGRVTGLVLVGAPRSLHGRMPPFADDVAGLRDPIDTDWVKTFVGGFTVPEAVPQQFLQERVRDALAVPARIWMASLTGLGDSPAPPSERISAPTLVISGGRDLLLSREDASDLARTIQGARSIIYPDAGHVVHWEQPEPLARDISSFIAGLSESGRSTRLQRSSPTSEVARRV